MAWIIKALGYLLKLIPTGLIIKFVIGSFAILLLPKALKYFYLKWGDEVLSYAMTKISSMTGIEYSGLVVEFTGLVGYVAVKLRVVDCFAMIVTASITMFFLSFLRK